MNATAEKDLVKSQKPVRVFSPLTDFRLHVLEELILHRGVKVVLRVKGVNFMAYSKHMLLASRILQSDFVTNVLLHWYVL